MEVNGESTKGKWINGDTTVTIDKTDMVGTIGKDTLVFEGILKELVCISMDLKFAKYGTMRQSLKTLYRRRKGSLG